MSKEFKKLATTVIITAIVFLNLGILAVKVADSNNDNEVKVVKEYNTDLDYLIDSDTKYIKVAKPNTFYSVKDKRYTLYIVDDGGNLVREWQYFTD
ncbi:hypothetical protein FG877_02140 [Enterococcus casseliflavus]|nr:hypothetical protein [Enterococcus casseliflavus]